MRQRIVIIGGGFAGINLFKHLSKSANMHITLVDKNNYNFFPPLIYQVATGFLEPSSISYPFRSIIAGREHRRFWMGELLEVVPAENKVKLSNGELEYDVLVMATGTTTNFFGIQNIRKYAIPMNTLEDAINMRNILLQRIEMATKAKTEEEKLALLTMVIAGGGATGVEISGMFAEMRNEIIYKEYPELHGTRSSIYLVSGSDNLLAPMSKKSQDYACEKLKGLGVELVMGMKVVDFDGDNISLSDGSVIICKNLIWATGVKGLEFPGIPKESIDRGTRLKVDAFHKVAGTTNIYAIGDGSIMYGDKNFPAGHPQLAQVAIQQGRNLAKNLDRLIDGKDQIPFVYNDRGSLAIIGKSKAVADLPRFHLNGFPALFIWGFVHLFSLVSYSDRVRTVFNWMVAYLKKNQDLRMIIRPEKNP